MVLRHAQGLGVLQHHGAAEGVPRSVLLVLLRACAELQQANGWTARNTRMKGGASNPRHAPHGRSLQSSTILCELTDGGLDCVQEDVLLYGGEGAGDLRPEFVPKLNWLLATDFMPGFSGTVCAFVPRSTPDIMCQAEDPVLDCVNNFCDTAQEAMRAAVCTPQLQRPTRTGVMRDVAIARR